jgi:SLOG-like protein
VAHEVILPPDALGGKAIGVSVSDSPDLGRLGLTEVHLRLTLGEVARSVLFAGGGLVYGGHLDPSGYTAFLQAELEKYGRGDRPLLVCLAWQEHRERSLEELDQAEASLGLRGEIEYLSREGSPVDKAEDRDDAPVPVMDTGARAEALTGLRRYLTRVCDARVLIGGRRDGYQGAMPGIVEEALLAIEASQPVFLAGGFGGVTYDAVSVLGLTVQGWPQLAEGRANWGSALVAEAKRSGWQPESNGLTRDENLRLAASHRPSDVATLVALGLNRLAGDLGGTP